jgi:hypothetical protein
MSLSQLNAMLESKVQKSKEQLDALEGMELVEECISTHEKWANQATIDFAPVLCELTKILESDELIPVISNKEDNRVIITFTPMKESAYHWYQQFSDQTVPSYPIMISANAFTAVLYAGPHNKDVAAILTEILQLYQTSLCPIHRSKCATALGLVFSVDNPYWY